MRRRLLILVLGLGLCTPLGAWLGVRAVGEWRFRAELRRAEGAFNAGRFGEARSRLSRLSERRPGRGAVEYWLGICEKLGGHPDAALAAWGRVPADAEEAPLAALARGRLALDVGRYGLSESCLGRAARGGKEVADEARRLLGRLHWLTGRLDGYRSALRRQAERDRDPSETLRTLWSVDTVAYPLEAMRTAVEKGRRVAPDDDRVWLALAQLATSAGRVEEADGWLRRCEAARPDDPAVWHARLDWARAADRPDEAARASARLPAADFPEARVLALRAWLAAKAGDRPAERAALEGLLDREPGDAAALDRLADLSAQAGETERVTVWRRRKAAIDAARERYRALMSQPELAPHAAELAAAAEAFGRWFDARVWWAFASRRDASKEAEAQAALARLPKPRPRSTAGGRTLADRLTPHLPATGGPGPAPAPGGPSVPGFTEDAGRSGLVFTFENGRSDLRQLPETMSGGAGVLDFDGDGLLDVYAVQGGPFPPPAGTPPFGDRLFRNLGDGRFRDDTTAAGLAALPGGYGHGVAVGDYDNDGRPDLLVTRWRSYALYHNRGGGRFEDATGPAGLGGDRDCPTSAAWADLDNDGDLDLYVCHYLEWDPATTTPCVDPPRPEHTYCDPRNYPALPDHVFRNDGGHFVDVTRQAGIVDRDGRGLGVVAADLDGDGRTDLFVANDTSANFFFRNLGHFRFAEGGDASGLAGNADGGHLAGMGIACGDLDGDGRLDLAVTNFYGESTTLYHNLGGGQFADRSAAAGLALPTRYVLGFGLAALDANNDGRLDLAQANGHVNDYRPTTPYPMPPQLFLGDRAGRFVDASSRAGPPWQVPRLGRGLAVADLDNDGRLDVLLVAQNAPLALLWNRDTSGGHSLTLALEGTASNRDAVGARVVVTCSGRTQVGSRFGGGSYLSAGDPRLHFGLGPARTVDRVEVTWPSGRRDRYQNLAADAFYRLREGDPSPRPLSRLRTSSERETPGPDGKGR